MDKIVSAIAFLSLVSLVGIIYPFKPFTERWIALVSFLVCIGFVVVFSSMQLSSENARLGQFESKDGAEYWVRSQRLNRRTCPSVKCGIVGQFFFRAGVKVFERRGGWVRITELYHASCVDGRSEYVDSGNDACEISNGVSDGKFAEWVSAEYLAADRPRDPAANASKAEKLVAGSDDFARYRAAFTKAAEALIGRRRCSEQDFREMGGWVKSSTHRNEPIYFTYCGGATVANRLYLNADTGEIFR